MNGNPAPRAEDTCGVDVGNKGQVVDVLVRRVFEVSVVRYQPCVCEVPSQDFVEVLDDLRLHAC